MNPLLTSGSCGEGDWGLGIVLQPEEQLLSSHNSAEDS